MLEKVVQPRHREQNVERIRSLRVKKRPDLRKP